MVRVTDLGETGKTGGGSQRTVGGFRPVRGRPKGTPAPLYFRGPKGGMPPGRSRPRSRPSGRIDDRSAPTPLNPIQRLRQSIRNVGLGNTLLYEVDRVLSTVTRGGVRLHRYYFVSQPVPAKPLLSPSRGKNIALRWVDSIEPLPADLRPVEVLKNRFAAGAHCLLAEIDGRFAGFLWLQLTPYHEDEVRSIYHPQPPRHTAWDYDVYVDPAARVGFTFAKLWDEANAFMRARDIRWTLSRISAFNPGSLAAHARLGTRRIGSAVYLSAWSLQGTISDVEPRFHFSGSRRTAPALRLPADVPA